MVYGSVRNLPVSWRRKKASLKCKYSSRALGQHKLGTCNPERALHLNVQSINKKECKSLYFASVLFSTAQKTTQEDKCISLHWYLVTWYHLCFCVLNSVFVNYYLQLVNKLVQKHGTEFNHLTIYNGKQLVCCCIHFSRTSLHIYKICGYMTTECFLTMLSLHKVNKEETDDTLKFWQKKNSLAKTLSIQYKWFCVL